MEGQIGECLADAEQYMQILPRSAPAKKDLFRIDETSPLLPEERSHKFHSLVARLQYVSKRVRPDILTAVSFLRSRVALATESDWESLGYLIGYIKGTQQRCIAF
jgi:hypothetical protein